MLRLLAFSTSAVLMSGCVGSEEIAPLSGAQRANQTAIAHEKLASPATCDKGVRLSLRRQAGAFRVPPCGGWKGFIHYPAGAGISRWTVTSSLTNNFGVPPPQSGTALFYMQTWLRRPSGVRIPSGGVDDTVSSPVLTSDHTYTLNVYNFFYN